MSLDIPAGLATRGEISGEGILLIESILINFNDLSSNLC